MLRFISEKRKDEWFYLEMPHILYYELAQRSFFSCQEISSAADEIRTRGTTPSKADEDILYTHRLHMINIIVYSAFSLEAYINYYAAHYDIPFHNDYEKSLSTVNKWKIYPSLKINKTLEKPALDIIQKVFKLRNEIVHPKPERIKHGSVQPGNKSIKNIQGIIEVMDKGQFFIDVTSVFSSIFKIDPEEKKIYNDGPWLCHLKKAKQ